MMTDVQIQDKNAQKVEIPRRWSARKKREIVLRLLRGESLDSVSREIGLEVYILEEWKHQALDGIEASLKSRPHDPLATELDHAMKRIGELSMENELLRERG